MLEVKRWGWPGFIPLAVGLAWFSQVSDAGFVGSIFSGIPALMFVGCGVAMFAFPGDKRICQFLAFTAFITAILFILWMIIFGFIAGLFMSVSALLCAAVAGMVTLQSFMPVEEAPAPDINWKTVLKTAFDDAVVGMFIIVPKLASVDDHERLTDEFEQAKQALAAAGAYDDFRKFHLKPPVLLNDEVTIRNKKILGTEWEWLSFDSEYQPLDGMPGRERWQSYSNNQTAYALVLRHKDDKPRPWMIGIHGYMMDVLPTAALFSPKFFHEKLGFNLVLPILPLHGPRKRGRISGDGYIVGDLVDTLNAVGQSQWDIRRLHGWIRQQSDQPIAVHGYSLGGFNTALFASLESDLACAIPAIPLPSVPKLMWHHMPVHMLERLEPLGITQDEVTQMLKPIAPLAQQCLVEKDKRFFFAGAGDSVIPPEYTQLLADHWQVENTLWYQAGHMTFRGRREVTQYLRDAFIQLGLVKSAT